VNSLEALFDTLAIGAHPDDAELFAGGTLACMAAAGARVAVLDLTRGEAATLGSPELRAREAAEAARILGLQPREQLALRDGGLANDDAQRQAVVEAIRRLRPRLVLTHGGEDRHPDHRAAHALVRDAVFFANVAGYQAAGERWKVQGIAYFPGNSFQPDPPADWVVDISSAIATKKAALEAYSSQFKVMGGETGSPTYIGSPEFWGQLDRRARMWGHYIGVEYGEAFLLPTPAHAGHPLVRLTWPPQG
jgi:bacillithiol biosynthesis deacetylase BshB1